MRKEVKETRTGRLIRYICTPEEREEAGKRLFKLLDRIYERKIASSG
jgi:hypothetical protein